ncbi:MAG TPA: hypothetical protein VJ755_13225 [Gemmatimonadales bacterium]|nr:hypothetical protein [Gemmatimonadales bacterium]
MRLICLLVLANLAARATTGSTYRSGVGDKLLEQPPMFEPANAAGSPIALLLADMNAF